MVPQIGHRRAHAIEVAGVEALVEAVPLDREHDMHEHEDADRHQHGVGERRPEGLARHGHWRTPRLPKVGAGTMFGW